MSQTEISNFIAQAVDAFERAGNASVNARKAVANAREAVATVSAASEAAQIASTNATESLKLKTTQVLTDSKIRMLDVMAEITTSTANKAKDVAKQAESVLELAERNQAATVRHAQSARKSRNEARDAGKAYEKQARPKHMEEASRAAKQAIASAKAAQETATKTMEWEKRALELVDAIRDLNTAQQDAVQKASIAVDVSVQKPPPDLESVQEVTGDVSMNNSVVAANLDATKKAGDEALSTNDVVKAQETAQDATMTAIQATSNAQIALQNAEAAKALLDNAAERSLAGDDDDGIEIERATVVAEEAAQLAAEAKEKAIVATDAAKAAEKSVLKVATGTAAADYTMLYVLGALLLVVGAGYYLKSKKTVKANRSYY